MANPPPAGAVIEYPYLWLSQAATGETEGRKTRPVCLALSVPHHQTGEHHLLLLAISSQPPRSDQSAIQVPDTERRRAGLTRYPAAWIVTSEFNYDIAERSFYYSAATPVLGAFSPTFLKQVAAALRETLAQRRGRVQRSD
jgi:hypothetical protein